MKTKQVKFTGIQVLDEGYVRINFTGGVSHDIDVDDAMECANNPYLATWTASGTHCCCRFSNKSKALNWARGCARDNRQWRGTADFHVYKGKKIIYKATIWHDGKTTYYVNNGVEA